MTDVEAEEKPYVNPYPKMSSGTTVEVRMEPSFERILTTTFKIDVWGDYSQLEDDLKIGGRGYTDHETLAKALDGAEDNARKAHKLYCAARVEQERFELDAKAIEGAARRPVLRELQAEKEVGQRTKQITEADVEARMFTEYPDEFKRLSLSRLKFRKMVEHMSKLSELWTSRCRTLQTLLGKSR